MLTNFAGFATTGKAALCLAALALFPLTAPAAEKAAGSTLENLVAAFNGESNANARYVAFAVKVDEEGYKGVGSQFRAAARAENSETFWSGRIYWGGTRNYRSRIFLSRCRAYPQQQQQ